MLMRALFAFLALPGLFAVVLPVLLATFDPWRGDGRTGAFPVRPAVLAGGAFVLTTGSFVLAWCVRDFFVSGRGTLAPWDPPKRLVVVGLYRYVRNPMYVGVLLVVLGWSLVLGSPLIAAYVVALAAGFDRRVRSAEEPWLARQFGDEWKTYRENVPRWLPRRRAWP